MLEKETIEEDMVDLEQNPPQCEEIDLLEEVNQISATNFNRLLAWLENYPFRGFNPKDVAMVIKIAYECGLRPSEALRLRREDFFLKSSRIRLGKTKTERNGYASIPPKFLNDLALYLMKKQIGYVCRHRTRDVHYSYNAFYHLLKKAGKDLQIPALVVRRQDTSEMTVGHIFRKSKGKEMMSRGAGLNVISAKLRHSGKNGMAQTMAYLRLNLQDAMAWEKEHD